MASKMLLIENEIGAHTFVSNNVQHIIKNSEFEFDAIARTDCPTCYQSRVIILLLNHELCSGTNAV